MKFIRNVSDLNLTLVTHGMPLEVSSKEVMVIYVVTHYSTDSLEVMVVELASGEALVEVVELMQIMVLVEVKENAEQEEVLIFIPTLYNTLNSKRIICWIKQESGIIMQPLLTVMHRMWIKFPLFLRH